MSPSPSQVKSAERTLDVLEVLAAALRPVPRMAIARRCQMPKSSTHRLLNVLRERGWATYDPGQRGWLLGPSAQRVLNGRRAFGPYNGCRPTEAGGEPSRT